MKKQRLTVRNLLGGYVLLQTLTLIVAGLWVTATLRVAVGAVRGTGAVSSLENLHGVVETIAHVHVGVAIVLFALAAICGGAGFWFSRWINGRLGETISFLRNISTGHTDLNRRLQLVYQNCSQAKQCGQDECACFGAKEACWSHVGSMQLIREKVQCPSVLSGKVEDCSMCDVFRAVERNEFDTVANWLNIFAEKVCYTVLQLSEAGGDLASSASELSTSTIQIATSNEELSAQSQSMASATEQVSATVMQISKNTEAVRAEASSANQVAAEGSIVIEEALGAMGKVANVVQEGGITVGELGELVQTIGRVVDLIEDVADQTNLLALNAAIEAARAGEHGRGFAIVADEVRKLAEKTLRATQEISQKVGAVQQVSIRAVRVMEDGRNATEAGRALAEKGNNAIKEIRDRIASAADETTQIASAVEELTATMTISAQNMDQIAAGVQQSSVATQEISRTAKTVAAKADELLGVANAFNV